MTTSAPFAPGPFRVAGEVEGFRRGVGAGTGDHGKSVARRLHHDLHHALVLVVAQGGRLAGGTTRNQAVRAVRRVELHELPELRFVDFAAAERGDQRDEGALKWRHTVASPATRSSYVSRRRTIV